MTAPNPDQTPEQRAYAAAAAEAMENDGKAAPVAFDALGVDLAAEFGHAEAARRETEERMLKDLRQYKGQYEPEVLERIGVNRSKAFVRATRVKVKTVDARTMDLLFPNSSDRNYTIDSTPTPSLDEETMQRLCQELTNQLKRAPTPPELETVCKKFADTAAARMSQTIEDQLTESRYKEAAKQVLHSGHLYGTGILKAPLVERRSRKKYVRENGKWIIKQESYAAPFVDWVPIWHFYPDMSATTLDKCRYVWQRHLMTRDRLVRLSRNRSFKGDVIREYISTHPRGQKTPRWFEMEIRDIGDRTATQYKDDGQYEVLERWGYLDGEQLAAAGVEVPDDRMHETFFSNVWILPNGTLIKIVLQPLDGVTWPYHLYYADKDECSIFGEGFPAVMRDDQTMINAGTRMILDHAAITAGPQFEANMDLLSSSETAEDMYPFKIWRRNGSEPGSPALRVLNVTNGLEELFPIVAMFKENADDVTAIPRYMQGENATNGAAGTASGMSMLLANASIVMKDLIESYDQGITRTFIEAMYHWNMQFNPDNSIKGDFAVKARGTASLMAKEIRAQQLDQFASSTANELDGPYIKREELLRQRAEAHDLVSVVKTEQEVANEANNEAAQQQAEQQQKLQALALRREQAEVEKLEAEAMTQKAEALRKQADTERLLAQATKTNTEAAYAAMQAGELATERPHTAPAGDAILKSAGFQDKTPTEGTPVPESGDGGQPPLPDNAIDDPAGATVGANAGAHLGQMAGSRSIENEGTA